MDFLVGKQEGLAENVELKVVWKVLKVGSCHDSPWSPISFSGCLFHGNVGEIATR